MKELLQKLLASKALSFEEAREMILWIMSEEAVSVQAAALLALLQAKGAVSYTHLTLPTILLV